MEKLLNKNLPIEIGNVVEHKSDNRQMVVIGFGIAREQLYPDVLDKRLPVCRFFQDKSQTYIAQEFVFEELIVMEE